MVPTADAAITCQILDCFKDCQDDRDEDRQQVLHSTCLIALLLFSLPPNTIFRVFQNNTSGRQFVSDFIASGEVTPSSCLLAFIDQRLNLALQHFLTLFSEDI
jgi:hypothetical protein